MNLLPVLFLLKLSGILDVEIAVTHVVLIFFMLLDVSLPVPNRRIIFRCYYVRTLGKTRGVVTIFFVGVNIYTRCEATRN